MLANGAKLGYKKKGGSAFTDLPGLKEIPEIGVEPEKVDNTCLTDPHKTYEMGIGDLPEMTYKFRYDNTKEDSPYRVMRKAQDVYKRQVYRRVLQAVYPGIMGNGGGDYLRYVL